MSKEIFTYSDLELREDKLHYLKSSDKPFTGKITGQFIGKYVNGLEEGPWKYYHLGYGYCVVQYQYDRTGARS